MCFLKDKLTWRPDQAGSGTNRCDFKAQKKRENRSEQASGKARERILGCAESKQTTVVLTTRPRTSHPRKTKAVDDRNNVSAVKKRTEKKMICSWWKRYYLISQAGWTWCHGVNACMTASVMGWLIFVDDVSHNGSSKTNKSKAAAQAWMQQFAGNTSMQSLANIKCYIII